MYTITLGRSAAVALCGDEEEDQAEAEEGAHGGAHGRADGALELGRDALGMAHAETGEIEPDPGEQQLGKGDPDHCARFLRHGRAPAVGGCMYMAVGGVAMVSAGVARNGQNRGGAVDVSANAASPLTAGPGLWNYPCNCLRLFR